MVKNNDNPINEQKIVDQLRVLAIDMIHQANSGHPGIALGIAPTIYTLFAHHLNVIPTNKSFYNRDRFILSAGHASALLYATLYLAGFDVELEDLMRFRQIDSITPGHPEYEITPGVDMSTGPLGQGLASAVGIAMGEAHTEALLEDGKDKIINYYTYVLASDGDIMEGVVHEAASLAGIHKLNKLIVLYDSNDISLDGKTSLSLTEKVRESYEAMGWNTILVTDGEDLTQINKAIEEAKEEKEKPTLIEIKTTIGKYSKFQGTSSVHGKPLDVEDITNIKTKLNFRDIPFAVSSEAMEDFQYLINERVKELEVTFNEQKELLPEEKQTILNSLMLKNKRISFANLDFSLPNDRESLRDTAGNVLNAYANKYPILFGGSADLFSSCRNYIQDQGDFSSNNYLGKNIYFGVREHAMAAILNGLALVGFRPYGSTFLAFSDYMKPAIRLSALMKLPVIYIFTHDSLAVGEDGPTHQAVEQITSLRMTPNLDVFKPADANEVLGSYKAIMEKEESPAAICLSKNELPILANASITGVSRGGYILKYEQRHLDGILISAGEEVHYALAVANRLFTKGIDLRVVSMPNLQRFLKQSPEYIDEILPVEKRKIVIEMASSYNWNKIIFNDKYIISQDDFGASGKKDDVLKKYGFDIDSLEEKIEKLLS